MRKELYLDEKVFLLKNYNNMTYKELLSHFNSNRSKNNQLTYGNFRNKIRELNLKRYDLIHWSKSQNKYLIDNYKTKGNTEIAQILSSDKFRSKKVFTADKVRKKMELLNLHRTPEELHNVVMRNIKLGLTVVNSKGKSVREPTSEYDIKIGTNSGRLYKYIKINGKYILYGRWNYEQHFGKIEKGKILFRKDFDSLNDNFDNYEIRKPGTVTIADNKRALKLLKKRVRNRTDDRKTKKRLYAIMRKINQKLENNY